MEKLWKVSARQDQLLHPDLCKLSVILRLLQGTVSRDRKWKLKVLWFDNVQAPLLQYITWPETIRGINSTSTLRSFLCDHFVPKRLVVTEGGELSTVHPGRSSCNWSVAVRKAYFEQRAACWAQHSDGVATQCLCRSTQEFIELFVFWTAMPQEQPEVSFTLRYTAIGSEACLEQDVMGPR